MKSLKITHFFDVIKKEVACEDEQITPVTYDHTAVKQEYHYKEELDVSWDERHNDFDSNKENVDVLNNLSHKFSYPIVLLEKLPDNGGNKHIIPIHQAKNALGSLTDKTFHKKQFLQYYQKFCPNCKRTESFEKKNPQCKYCDIKWNYECKNCKKQSRSYTSIIDHLKSKCLGKGHYFACFKCDYKSVFKFKVNKHLKNVHSIFHALNRIEQFESDNVQKDTAAKLHQCSKCGKEFQKLPPLLRHMQKCGQAEDNASSNNLAATPNVVKGRRVHFCLKCNKTVKDDKVGTFHQKKCQSCDSKLSFKCKECNKIFSSYNGINNHLKFSHTLSEDVFKCHQCDYETSHIEHLTRHVVRKHSIEPHECQICGRKYKNRDAFNSHLRNSYVEQPKFECDICSYRSKTKQNLRRHIIELHTEGNKIECPKCNIILKSENCLRVHLGYCKKEPRHQCDKCSFKTKYQSCLTKHYENVHSSSSVKKEQCPRCAKQCKNAGSLRSHLRRCGNNAVSSCEICSRLFKSKHMLKQHLIRAHSKSDDDDNAQNILYFYCDNCTYKSKFKGDLAKHVVIHLDDHKKKCPECKKHFCNEYFKKHVTYCKKPLKCSLCNHRASSKECLKMHIANIHSKGQELDCPKCSKTCKNKRYMKAHLRRCGTDPHLQCDYCSYKTKYKYRLKLHTESSHSKSKKRRLE